MRAVYHTNIDELTSEFLDSLKMQFKNAKVDIVVTDIDEKDNNFKEKLKMFDELVDSNSNSFGNDVSIQTIKMDKDV